MKARDLKNFLPERNNGIQTVYVQGFNACLDELAEKEITLCGWCIDEEARRFNVQKDCKHCQGHGIVCKEE